MSGKDIANASSSDNISARWDALDSRLERLANASDRMLADRGDRDRNRELKAVS